MKKRTTKLLALLMAAAIVFSLAACGKDNDETTTVAVTTAAGDTTVQGDTAASEETTAASEATTNPGDTTVAGETTTVKTGLPVTDAEILAAYTAVMNKAKTDKPGFKKYEYQELPDGAEYRNVTPAKVMSKLLDLAGGFMTTQDEAKKSPGVYEKNGNMKAFPLKDSDKGCLLTDVNAIKSADCTQLSNGNYKLIITLKNETNPAHYRSGNTAPSKTGSIFVPLDKSDVDPELSKFPVNVAVSNAQYSMEYSNCTVTLVYNPVTQQVVSVDQILYNALTLSGKVIGISASGTQTLIMHYNIFDVTY